MVLAVRYALYGLAACMLCVFALLPLRAFAQSVPPAPVGSGWVQFQTVPARLGCSPDTGCGDLPSIFAPAAAFGGDGVPQLSICLGHPEGGQGWCELVGAPEVGTDYGWLTDACQFVDGGQSIACPPVVAYYRVLYASPPDGGASSPEGPSPATETAVQDVRIAVERATPFIALSAGCLFVLLFAVGYRLGADLG